MRETDGDPLSPWRRTALLLLASIFVLGCGVLTLGLKAVPKSELTAVTLAVVYVLTASSLQSAPLGVTKPNRIRPLALNRQLKKGTVRSLLALGSLVSLLLPWIWIIGGADEKEVQMLGPHLFLMMVQVLFEIWSYRSAVSVLIRIYILVGFAAYRLRILVRWLEDWVFGEGVGGWAMFCLALVNLVFSAVILFYVLLLKVCPPYFLERELKNNMVKT